MTDLKSYHLLGRSGLRVSSLCLGTMTFGTEWGWGSEADAARQILNRYLEVGGNFVDTANMYTNGKSEELLGQFMKEAGNRDRIVLATKYTFNTSPGDPNAGANGRKSMRLALEDSLRRLKTDYIDLYWMHAWDQITPVEEVMRTFDDLVTEGKIRYIGLSDTPAWYATRAQTLAEWRGWERVAALQLEYSLAERNIEREHIPAALELGFGICPWSPLAGGLLTGKYQRSNAGAEGTGRLTHGGAPRIGDRFTEKNWAIVEALVAIAKELGRSPAQVALNWVTKRPGVASTIIGATKLSQLEDNLSALTFDIPAGLRQKLDDASAPELVFPYNFFKPELQQRMSGGVPVQAEPKWLRPQG